jgi:hypothetical protein
MSRGYRSIILTLVGLALSYPIHEAKSTQPNAEKRAEQSAESLPPVHFSAIQNSLDGIAREIKRADDKADTKRENERADRDLIAQEGMERWAFGMIVVATVSTILSVVGVILIWRTLVHTRRAADAAWNAVDDNSKAIAAMLVSNQIAKDAQRPWVSIEVEITESQFFKEMARISYVIRFKNIGKTIADNLLTVSECHFVGQDHPKDVVETFEIFRASPHWLEEGGTLMPAEYTEHRDTRKTTYAEIPWYGEPGDRRFHLIICAAAYYNVPGEPEFENKRFTERTFFVGIKNANPAKQTFIHESRISSLTPQTAAITQTYVSRTS